MVILLEFLTANILFLFPDLSKILSEGNVLIFVHLFELAHHPLLKSRLTKSRPTHPKELSFPGFSQSLLTEERLKLGEECLVGFFVLVVSIEFGKDTEQESSLGTMFQFKQLQVRKQKALSILVHFPLLYIQHYCYSDDWPFTSYKHFIQSLHRIECRFQGLNTRCVHNINVPSKDISELITFVDLAASFFGLHRSTNTALLSRTGDHPHKCRFSMACTAHHNQQPVSI